jgi:general secretion pathway protein L
VSGGGGKLRELGSYLAHQLSLYPVGPRQGFGANSPKAFSVAFGLAIHPKIVRPRWRFKPSPGGLALDLKAVTEAAGPKSETSTRDRQLAMWGGVLVALLALADISLRVMLQENRVAQLKTALRQQYETVFASPANPGDELDQARYRLGLVEKALALVDAKQGTVLETLSTFVKQLPAGIPVKVRELTVDGGMILLEGETTSFDAVEKIKRTFIESASFRDVAVTETRVGAAPNQVVFRMTGTVHQP